MQTHIKDSEVIPNLSSKGLHPKNQILKDRLLNADHWICMERAKFYTDSFKKTEGAYPSIRTAKAFKHVFENMTIKIDSDELMVGNRSSQYIAPPIAPERGDMTFVIKYMLPVLKKRYGYHISKEHKKWLNSEIIPYWKEKTVRAKKVKIFEEVGLSSNFKLGDGGLKRIKEAFGLGHIKNMITDPDATFTDKVKFILQLPKWIKAMKAGTADNVKGRGRCIDTQAHIVVGHKNVLKYGFKGIKESAEKRMESAKLGSEKGFLEGVVIVCEAMRDFSKRFAVLAKNLAKNETDIERKNELLNISEMCEKIPWNPAETFYEALQLPYMGIGAAIFWGIVLCASFIFFLWLTKTVRQSNKLKTLDQGHIPIEHDSKEKWLESLNWRLTSRGRWLTEKNFRDFCFKGCGTEDDPYLVEDIIEPHRNLSFHHIKSSYVIVQFCELKWISLNGCQHFTISNCIANTIGLTQCFYNEVLNNKSKEIKLWGSYDNTVRKNETIVMNISASRGNSIEGNWISEESLKHLTPEQLAEEEGSNTFWYCLFIFFLLLGNYTMYLSYAIGGTNLIGCLIGMIIITGILILLFIVSPILTRKEMDKISPNRFKDNIPL